MSRQKQNKNQNAKMKKACVNNMRTKVQTLSGNKPHNETNQPLRYKVSIISCPGGNNKRTGGKGEPEREGYYKAYKVQVRNAIVPEQRSEWCTNGSTAVYNGRQAEPATNVVVGGISR